MPRPHPRRANRPAVLLMALLSCAFPRAVLPALPPPVADEPSSRAMGATAAAEEPRSLYELVPVRWRGSVSYGLRRDWGDDGSASEQTIGSTLSAITDMPVWQPWFGRFNAALDFTALRYRSHQPTPIESGGSIYSLSSRTVVFGGQAQLSLFPLSRFPFEAHFNRTDSRTATTLSALDGYTSQRLGFSQRYRWLDGNVMFGWDRGTQTSLRSGDYKQDSLQLQLSQQIGPDQAFRLTGTGTHNTHENTGELSAVNALYAQHTLRSGEAFTLDSTADISRSHNRLALTSSAQSDWRSRLVQLNSVGNWRPPEQPLTVTGGVRLLRASNSWELFGFDSGSSSSSWKSLNLAAGASYSLSPALRVNASGNVNFGNSAGVQTTSTTETAGINYTPAPIALGAFQYLWTGDATASNRSGGEDAGHTTRGQLSHSLSRSIALDQNSAVNAQATQTITAGTDTRDGATRELTHTGLVSWSAAQESSNTLLQLNGSDRRTWGARSSYFQLVNAQATGTFNSGRYTSWSGNLTIQATRQRFGLVYDPAHPDALTVTDTGGKFVPTSSGSVTYQNRRAFNVPRLVGISELRLNSQSLLPMVGGPQDQETASWENRLEYTIGRAAVRFSTRVSRTAGHTNKAILLMLTRDFGGGR